MVTHDIANQLIIFNPSALQPQDFQLLTSSEEVVQTRNLRLVLFMLSKRCKSV